MRKSSRLSNELTQKVNDLYAFSKDDINCITGSNLFAAPIEE